MVAGLAHIRTRITCTNVHFYDLIWTDNDVGKVGLYFMTPAMSIRYCCCSVHHAGAEADRKRDDHITVSANFVIVV